MDILQVVSLVESGMLIDLAWIYIGSFVLGLCGISIISILLNYLIQEMI